MDWTDWGWCVVGAVLAGTSVGGSVWALTPVWDKFAERHMGSRVPDCLRLGLDRSVLFWGLRMWGAACVITPGVFCILLRMPPVAVVVGILVYMAPRYALEFALRRRQAILRDQLVLATMNLANTAEAGMSLPQGLEIVSRDAPQPLAQELRRIVAYYERGVPLNQAIEAVRQRLQLEAFTLFAAAIKVAIERGGRLNESLSRISYSLQENQRLERKIAAETASGRRAVQILAIFPPAFLLLFYQCSRQEVSYLFTTTIGQVLLATAIVIEYIGLRMAIKVVRLDTI